MAVDAFKTKINCENCKGTGERIKVEGGPVIPCDQCDGDGLTLEGTVDGAEQIADLTDKVNDILDKVNDIKEKLNE